jgi:hypothetical protein
MALIYDSDRNIIQDNVASVIMEIEIRGGGENVAGFVLGM